MENKTGKYLKYAIGEIVLVVIGILIALQINNWNNNKKSNAAETKLLKELLQDTKSDSIFFKSRMDHMYNHMELSKNLNLIYDESANDSIKSILYGDYPIFDISMAYQASVVINFKNKIDEFSNDSIQQLIRDYILQHHYIELAYEQKDRLFEKYAGESHLFYSDKMIALNENSTIEEFYNAIEFKKHHKTINYLNGTVENSLLRTQLLLNINDDLIQYINMVLDEN
ncbi:MAG: hypothetical protein BM563_02245 [Bacteroidetes bacterium MedPE-SWsnd-G1]|nr:MAG: hypothetical protein BM563_02245 [Bacteroidetes bacterium MedPE-SWsnd-G1]